MVRNELYDRAKGIGIILVIFGHLVTYGSPLFRMVFACHMPLFFIIPGLFFKPSNTYDKYKKIVLRYFTPYFVFGVVLLTLSVGYKRLLLHKSLINNALTGGCKLITLHPNDLFIDVLWFLPALTFSLLSLNAILSIREKIKITGNVNVFDILVLFLLTAFAIISERHELSFIPFQLKILSGCLLFAYIGNRYGCQLVELSKNINNVVLLLLVIIYCFLAYYNSTVNISIPTYGNILFCILGALIGFVIIIKISSIFKWKWLSYYGRNSLVCFAFNGVMYFGFPKVLSLLINEDYSAMGNLPIEWCIVGSLVIALACIPLVYITKPLVKLVKF